MLLVERPVNGGVQKVHRFDNDYGASVVRHSFSYNHEGDLWEIAVIKFTGPEDMDWDVTYETPLTDDVIEDLTDEDVEVILKHIKDL